MKHLTVLTAALALGMSSASFAQEAPKGFPDRPIEMVVVYPSGGGMDVTARILAKEAERVLGHKFRVQNRTGGGGIVGETYLAKNAPADGYTVGVLTNPFVALDLLVRDAPFKASDFVPITGINFTPVLWVVRTDGPLSKSDFPAILDQAKEKPADLKIAVMASNVFDFVVSIVERSAKVNFTHVPFQGGKPGVTALLGGHVDIASAFYEEVEPYLRAGQLKAVAISDQKRMTVLPDVPTMAEFGIKLADGVWGSNRFVTVSPKTPEPVRKYLEHSFLKVLKDPQTVEEFKKVGITVNATNHEETQRNYDKSIQEIDNFLKEQD